MKLLGNIVAPPFNPVMFWKCKYCLVAGHLFNTVLVSNSNHWTQTVDPWYDSNQRAQTVAPLFNT